MNFLYGGWIVGYNFLPKLPFPIYYQITSFYSFNFNFNTPHWNQNSRQNVSPPLRIDFVQVVKKKDGFKPCPVPLTVEESTDLAMKRFKIQSKRSRRGTPVS